MPKHPGKHVSQKKAKKILKDGKVRGKKLTKKQKGFFGARASGQPVRISGSPTLSFKKPEKTDYKELNT